MTKTANERYPYLVLGVVGAVALVAVFYILGAFPDFSRDTVQGQATLTGMPTLDDFPLVAAEVGETFYNGPVVLTLTAVYPQQAQFTSQPPGGAISQRALKLGQSIPLSGITVTLVALRETEADFVIAAAQFACPNDRDEQTPVCNGKSACTGGVCKRIPVCGETDGPVTSDFERQFYCCDGKLGFTACTTTNQECKTTLDCPQINCFQAPCPVYACENGACVPHYTPSGGTDA